jgi:DNA-binding NtrC family response regulator
MTNRDKILIVDDEPGVRFGIREFFETNGYAVDEAASFAEAERQWLAGRPDLALVDYNLPDADGIELIRRLVAFDASIPIVVLTAHGSIDLAVRAVKEGAEQFLTKPVELPVLLVIARRLLDLQRSRKRQAATQTKESRNVIDVFLGQSPVMQRLASEAKRLVVSESPILIQGETGTGKGVLAAWLHRNGPRNKEAFVDLNCASLSREFLETELFGHEKGAFTGAVSAKPGLLEVAHRGTLFLDEVGDLDLAVQPKLLKVLEEQRYRRLGEVQDRRSNVRLVAATHHHLARLVEAQKFRMDLYYRIGTLPLVVPALRHRREDIPELSGSILRRLGRELGREAPTISPEAMRLLESYPWPGNVRELRNVLERALLLTDTDAITPLELGFLQQAAPQQRASDSSLTLAELERQHIVRVLEEERGQVESAAKRLGVPRSSLYSKLKRYGIGSSRI